MSSIKLFRDTLLRVTTDGGCKVSRQNYRRSFYDRSQGKANKRKNVIRNVTQPHPQTENLVHLQDLRGGGVV